MKIKSCGMRFDSSFSASNNYAWTGTYNGNSNNAWIVNSNGNTNNNNQSNSYVVPAALFGTCILRDTVNKKGFRISVLRNIGCYYFADSLEIKNLCDGET